MRIFIISVILLISCRGAIAQSGINWSQTASITTNQFGNMHPRVATDGSGNTLAIWGNSNAKAVYFSRQTGNGFTSPVKLNPDTIPVFAASWAGPDMASHGDTIYVVFKETPEDVNGIYIVHSFDGGITFSAPVRVDAIADSISRFPAVAVDAAGNPMVALMKFNPGWGNPRYVLAKSSDFGSTFETDVLASGFSGGVVCDCCPATVTASGNTTAVLYRDNLNNLRNSWAGISFDGGGSFSNGIEIDDTDWMISACPSSGPDGIIIGDTLYSVFMSAASGKTLCYRSRSTISSQQMEFIEPLTGSFAGLNQQNFPRIAAAGNAVAIIWIQNVNGNAQLAVQFTDDIRNGFPAGYDILVPNNVVNADIAVVNGKIVVVWEAGNDGTVKYKTGTFAPVSLVSHITQEHVIHISPNPVSENVLNIHLEDIQDQPVVYSVYTATGAILLQGEQTAQNDQISLDVSALPGGYYLLSLQSGKYNSHGSFIRQ